MKHILTSLLVATTLAVNAAQTSAPLSLPIRGGVDGDTIRSQIDALPCPLCKVSVRIRGIDTPEKGVRAKCAKEADLANQASNFTKSLINSATTMTILDTKWDKYGGRIDGYVIINNHNIGDQLIKAGLAQPYTGKGRKPDWCS